MWNCLVVGLDPLCSFTFPLHFVCQLHPKDKNDEHSAMFICLLQMNRNGTCFFAHDYFFLPFVVPEKMTILGGEEEEEVKLSFFLYNGQGKGRK